MKIEVFTGYIYCDYSGKQTGFLFRDVNEKLVFLFGRIKTSQLGDTGADELAFPGPLPTFIYRGHSGRGRALGATGSLLMSVQHP